jgi:hypothetical protein
MASDITGSQDKWSPESKEENYSKENEKLIVK